MNWVRVEGASMRPFLLPGDSVAVDWERAHGTEVGAVVIGRDPSDGGWIVHRVVPAASGELRLKGDAAFALDAIGPGEVWGRVVAVRDGLSREKWLHVNSVDRLIASLSVRALPPDRLRSRVLRRAVFALAWMRRAWA